jgi:ankyrin repeat protein
MYQACKHGDSEKVLKMLPYDKYNLVIGLYYACYFGHSNIVDILIGHGAHNWNVGLIGACSGNNIDLVKLMVYHGANNLQFVLLEAAKCGYLDICTFIVQRNIKIKEFNTLHRNVIILFICHGAKNYRELIILKQYDLAVLIIKIHKLFIKVNLKTQMILANYGAHITSQRLTKRREQKQHMLTELLDTQSVNIKLYDKNIVDYITKYIHYDIDH